jgi:3-hydroxyanthranilate 3,4-dioxygenase
MQAIDLNALAKELPTSPKPLRVLWQAADTLAFVVRGREGRREFHKDPVDEVMYMIKGDMDLHYLTAEGEEKIASVKEGEIIYCPAGVPHSPRLPTDAILLVLERKRRADEVDRFLFRCERCGGELFEVKRQVRDYNDNVLRDAYEEFYERADMTCRSCGHVDPGRPAKPI